MKVAELLEASSTFGKFSGNPNQNKIVAAQANKAATDAQKSTDDKDDDLFRRTAPEIARQLKQDHKDYGEVSQRLKAYQDRKGKAMTPAEKSKFDQAKKQLKQKYGVVDED